jgi:monoamine oxidase
VVSSFAAILTEIARGPLESAKLLLGQKVVRISNGESATGDSIITIGTESGENLTFDGVVVTTPLGWLKRNESAFQPELPSPVRAAVDSISVGHLEKVTLVAFVS